MKLLVFLIFSTLCHHCHLARILAVFPLITKSHYMAGRKVVLELTKRGHEVVCISPFEEKNASTNYKWIDVEVKSFYDAVPEMKNEIGRKLNFFSGQHRLWKFTNAYSKHVTSRPKLKEFIENDHSHFDLVLAEEFLQEVFYAFAYKYKAPLVLLSTFGPAHYINEYMGNSMEISYVAHEFSELFGELGFLDRVKNLVYTTYDLVARKYYSREFQNNLAKDVFKNVKGLPSVEDLERNASLILVNSHFTLSTVRPYLPNIVEIGGIHIEKVKPLDKELKELLDGAKKGAILFSLGSVLELASQPEYFVREVLLALGKMEQVVLIKWNSEEKPPLTFDNIHPFKWLPQNDVLAHPNVIAFVTHGGLHSAMESIYHGVPTVCTPFYGDQPLNCKKSVDMGFGIKVSNISETTLHEALKTVISDKSYKITAEELSRRFKDRPVSALDSAMFWIEFVIRHNGADFLKGPKRNLYWFQHMFLDVVLVLIIAVWILTKMIKILLGLVFKKKTEIKSKKVKKN